MRLSIKSPVVLIFSAVCALVYFLSGEATMGKWFAVYPQWDFGNAGWYFRLFSHVVGHASMEHLMGNMALFLLLGPIVEDKYGSLNLVIMILSTALVTGFIHIMFFDVGLLGASGVVFMLILLVSLANFRNKEIPLTFILVVIVFIGKEIMGTFEDDNISHSTHIIGGIVGACFGFILAGKRARGKTETVDPII